MTQPPDLPGLRTRYVARELAFGRERVLRLARERGALLGWDSTTLRVLAAELADDALAKRKLAVADDLALADLAGTALDECAAAGALPPAVAEHVATVGFRNAIWDAIAQLRVAGVAPATLRATARTGTAAAATAAVLARYELLLEQRALADPAAVLRLAIEAARTLPAAAAHALLVEHGTTEVTGLAAEFLRQLVDRGAVLEPAPPDMPTFAGDALALDLFRAATPADEVREVLRRALHEGLRWDDIELSVTDTDTYGVALAALGARLGIPFTLKEGIPLARTRSGRGLARFLSWLSSGLSATLLREMLESSDLAVPGLDGDVSEAAHAIRMARIGWGRDRMDAARARFASGDWAHSLAPARDTAADEHIARLEQLQRRAAAAVCALDALLAITPPVPALGATADSVQANEPALARAALGWLALFEGTVESDDERATVARLRARLEVLVRDGSTTPRAFDVAMAALHLGLANLRAFPSVSRARAPRTSLPGAVHLTHASHAGVTGRPRLFVLGLDADRAGGARLPDPILDDRTREALGGVMDTTGARAERKQRLLRRALAGLSGRVTLSYASATDGAGHEASPSALLLGAMRALRNEPALSYDEFRRQIGPPASAVPATDVAPLDSRDAWLAALASGPVMLDGTDAVREAHAALARGLDVRAQQIAARANEWHGLVPDAANTLGPAANTHQVASASSLELLARCPLAWFYEKGLGLRPPDDIEFEGGQWLDPKQRGTVLHSVFERFVTAWRARRAELAGAEAESDALAILMDEVATWRRDVPPPSEMVFERELRRLEKLLAGFLAAERDDFAHGRTANWLATELAFPAEDATGPVRFDAGQGARFRIRGFVDRVDELPDGSLRVVDYKTGSSYKFKRDGKAAPFNNGRLLQPALYAAAVVQLLDRVVARFEYRFPGERPPGNSVVWRAEEFAEAVPIVRSLLGDLAAGAFVATDNPDDCKYCDHAPICRVQTGEFTTSSPRAEWAREFGANDPAYAGMRQRRAKSGE